MGRTNFEGEYGGSGTEAEQKEVMMLAQAMLSVVPTNTPPRMIVGALSVLVPVVFRTTLKEEFLLSGFDEFAVVVRKTIQKSRQ